MTEGVAIRQQITLPVIGLTQVQPGGLIRGREGTLEHGHKSEETNPGDMCNRVFREAGSKDPVWGWPLLITSVPDLGV